MHAVSLLLLGLLLAAVALRGGVGPASGLVVAAAGALACLGAASTRLRGASAPALGLLAAWAVLALAQIGWAHDRDAALDGAGALLAAAAALLVAATVVPERDRERWLLALALCGGATAVVALLLTPPGARAQLPLGNPNQLGAWLLLPFAVALAGLSGPTDAHRGGVRMALWIVVAGLCVAALTTTGSAGAALAAAAGVCTLALARLAGARALQCVGVGIGFAAVLLAIVPALAPELLPWARDGQESSPGIRWLLYGVSTRAALAASPLGTGIGGFASAFAAGRPGELHYAPRHAHSEPLHAWVELGLPFVVLACISAGALLWRLRQLRIERASFAVRAAGLAGVAVAAHALIDAPLHVPAVGVGLAAVAGLAWPAADPEGPRWQTRAALAGVGALLLAIGVTDFGSSRASERAQRALDEGHFAAAEAAARQAVTWRTGRAAAHGLVADAAWHAYELGGGGRQALDRSIAARRTAVGVRPRDASLHVALARALAHAGERNAALDSLDVAVALAPGAPEPHLARARILLALRRPDEAVRAVRAAVERHPHATHGVVSALLHATGDPALALRAVPERAFAYVEAGRALANAGYPRQAADALERGLALAPDDPRIAVEAARTWLAAGVSDRAIAVLARTLEHVPGDVSLRAELDRTLARGRGGRS